MTHWGKYDTLVLSNAMTPTIQLLLYSLILYSLLQAVYCQRFISSFFVVCYLSKVFYIHFPVYFMFFKILHPAVFILFVLFKGPILCLVLANQWKSHVSPECVFQNSARYTCVLHFTMTENLRLQPCCRWAASVSVALNELLLFPPPSGRRLSVSVIDSV